MEELLEDAKEEIKRVDHLFYVSLKYTRTVDMMRNMIERLISTFDYGMLSLLEYAKEKKRISEIPAMPLPKCELLRDLYSDKGVEKYADLYVLLRKLMKASYTKREEYRRHVTMISTVGDKVVNTDIDILNEYYDKVAKFISLVQEVISSKK
ncbi:hypothetical protein KY358_02955 [Candidatus Woesearchaeota archaeon]|nr:hypothetical protein [Candidatus Woesearchaeota archaeon]